jgi:hypothetical protein
MKNREEGRRIVQKVNAHPELWCRGERRKEGGKVERKGGR